LFIVKRGDCWAFPNLDRQRSGLSPEKVQCAVLLRILSVAEESVRNPGGCPSSIRTMHSFVVSVITAAAGREAEA